MDIKTEAIEIPLAGGGAMGAYLARPDDGDARPAVLVFMEIFGINSHIRDVAERLAREGYVALAPDYFHRTGAGVEYEYNEEGMERGMELHAALQADEMVSDVNAALAWLEAQADVQSDRIGAIGFCIGGHMAYLSACETSVCCAASFYGGGIAAPEGPGGAQSTIDRTPKIKGRILCLFGERDGYIPPDQVEAIAAALKDAGVNHETIVYPDADHGFFCDQRDSHQLAAATDAWERVKALFAAELRGDR
ncbi:MAG: dienelactone hydrolase family protein [Deltaproteobacteria bacterium]|nr:dienelactone hydrolase family protein [Deltaproteobacteria bacterium]